MDRKIILQKKNYSKKNILKEIILKKLNTK